MDSAPAHIGVVVGESSGDLLGAAILSALRKRIPNLRCSGIGGPRLNALGCESLAPMSRLSLFGLWEPLRHLPGLLALRRRLFRHFAEQPPQLFLGIDAPDFNLGLETRLRRHGVCTAHCVSPSVWAWRQGRIRGIARAVELMLLLFPFEEDFYRCHKVPARFIGHPLADALPPAGAAPETRAALQLPEQGEIIALLPGSRLSEVRRHAELFLGAARWLQQRRPGVCFVMPAARPELRDFLQRSLRRVFGEGTDAARVRITDGRAHEVLSVSDAALQASGTVTLEALLLGCPMVVSYRLDPFTHLLARLLVRTPYVSLPNLLHGGPLVPEILNRDATPQSLGAALLEQLQAPPEQREALLRRFAEIRANLRRDAADNAAQALLPFFQPAAEMK